MAGPKKKKISAHEKKISAYAAAVSAFDELSAEEQLQVLEDSLVLGNNYLKAYDKVVSAEVLMDVWENVVADGGAKMKLPNNAMMKKLLSLIFHSLAWGLHLDVIYEERKASRKAHQDTVKYVANMVK